MLGIKVYDEEGLIPAIAAMLDEATKPTRIAASGVKLAKALVLLLKEHCNEYFVFHNPTYSKLKLLQDEVNTVTADEMLALCRYYNEEKDFSWASAKMGIAYLIKNVSTDLARALDYKPDKGPKIR